MSFPPLHRTPHLRWPAAAREDVVVPAPHPPEFRRRAVELARPRDKPVAEIAKELGISRVVSAELDGPGRRRRRRHDSDRLTSDEKTELAELRRKQAPAGDGERDPQAGGGVLRPGERPPKVVFPLVRELADDGIRRRGGLPGAWRVPLGLLRMASPARRLPAAQENELLLKHIEKIHARVPRHLRLAAGARRADASGSAWRSTTSGSPG